jgi:hypothetical protein
MRFLAASLVVAGIQDVGLDECRALPQQRIVRNNAGGDVRMVNIRSGYVKS